MIDLTHINSSLWESSIIVENVIIIENVQGSIDQED